jgi:ribonuclease III
MQIRNEAQNSKLAAVGFERGLDRCILLNDGTGKVSDKTMATTIEAILGAVELDAGPNALVEVATHLGLIHSSLNPVTSNSSFPR